MRTNKKGMTLLELTVVILVLLSLISILFIGARAWKRGTDRSGCILNLRNIQQAVRGEQNLKGANPGDAGLLQATILGSTAYIAKIPRCPTNNTAYVYAIPTYYPTANTLYATCPNIAVTGSTDHVPPDLTGW
jgi:prepilin-type N-terminal cleavage/methylation domain-containing protein